MIVNTILKTKARGQGIVTIGPAVALAEAAGLLAQHRIGAIIAVDGAGRIAGILSERDIVRAIAADGTAALSKPVSAYMTSSVITCTGEDGVAALMQTMTERRIRHLPVVDAGGALVGIVTIGDLVKSRLDEMAMETETLRDYVMAGR